MRGRSLYVGPSFFLFVIISRSLETRIPFLLFFDLFFPLCCFKRCPLLSLNRILSSSSSCGCGLDLASGASPVRRYFTSLLNGRLPFLVWAHLYRVVRIWVRGMGFFTFWVVVREKEYS